MRKTMKMLLILLLIFTAIYVGTIAYASTQVTSGEHADSLRYVAYSATKYRSGTPSVWYYPEELGIIAIHEVDSYWVQISVDRQKEPFSLPAETPIFLYKDEFWMVSSRYVDFFLVRPMSWQIPIGGALGTGWILIGAFFVKTKLKGKKEKT